jgi:hypothetical protein
VEHRRQHAGRVRYPDGNSIRAGFAIRSCNLDQSPIT